MQQDQNPALQRNIFAEPPLLDRPPTHRQNSREGWYEQNSQRKGGQSKKTRAGATCEEGLWILLTFSLLTALSQLFLAALSHLLGLASPAKNREILVLLWFSYSSMVWCWVMLLRGLCDGTALQPHRAAPSGAGSQALQRLRWNTSRQTRRKFPRDHTFPCS